jgi:hypothetical protein
MIIRENPDASEIISTIFDHTQKNQTDPDVKLLLSILGTFVKSRRYWMQNEIIKESNCEIFAKLIITTSQKDVRQKMMSLVQIWAFLFKDRRKYCALEV